MLSFLPKYSYLTGLFFCLATLGFAQPTTFKVITEVVEKQFKYQPGFEVNIEGQNAEIVVETWDQNEVKVIIELISKHPDQAIAERDIEALQFDITQHGQMIYFRNFIKPNAGKPEPEAQLKALYTVTLPSECPVYLKNNFGNASISNLSSLLRLNAEFTNILLQNLQGTTFINSRFGDITGYNLGGEMTIDTRRSDITLHNLSGKVNINSYYGIIKLFTDKSLVQLNIDANKSDVYFFDPNPTAYGYTLTAHYGTITAPSDLKFNFLENNTKLKKAVFQPSKEMATVSIKISFGNIVIRNP